MSLVKYNRTPNLFKMFFDDPAIKDLFMERQPAQEVRKSMPLANIKEGEDNFKIEMALPGFKKEQFELHLDENLLKVTAKTTSEKNEENEKTHLREFAQRSHERTFNLPDSIKTEEIDAKYEDGILTIVLPKDEGSKAKPARVIKVN